MVQVIHACCVLHNLANGYDLELLEPARNDDYPDPAAGVIHVPNDDAIIPVNERGRELRNELCRQLFE